MSDCQSLFIRNCPECNIFITYTDKRNLNRAIKSKSLCHSCKQIGDKNPIYGKGYLRTGKLHHNYGKLSPRKGKIFSDKVTECINRGDIWKNELDGNWYRKCPSCNENIKSSSHGHAYNRVKNKCMCYSCIAKNRKYSIECREKMRSSAIKRIKLYGNVASFNSIACKFIDEFGKKNGYNFQHGMNGGEVWIDGFSLDGYDKEKNIVFEYDEPQHEKSKNKLNDLNRVENLLKNKHIKSIIRYSEKFNKIYKSYPTYSEIL